MQEMQEMCVSWVREIPWRRKWQPTPVFLPGEYHGERSLVGCSPWGHKESDRTERLHFHFLSLIIMKYYVSTADLNIKHDLFDSPTILWGKSCFIRMLQIREMRHRETMRLALGHRVQLGYLWICLHSPSCRSGAQFPSQWDGQNGALQVVGLGQWSSHSESLTLMRYK